MKLQSNLGTPITLVIDESNQWLLTGGCCSEVVVKAGCTVLLTARPQNIKF